MVTAVQVRPSSVTAQKTNVSESFIDQLYGEFQPLVRRLIRQYGDTAENRAELHGEIYSRFRAVLDAYDPSRGVPMRPYIVRQLTASVYTYSRQRWRRQAREVSLDLSYMSFESRNVEDPSREWDEQLGVEQVLNVLPNAIAKLPKRQRYVIIWRYYDHVSFEEIAARLEVQVSTARSLLRHGLTNLRKSMVLTV